ncbi:MAG: polymer-forming cytoskeletal protein [Bacteroidales bacterium]|nr:polymer-forming cytoskeletal protein [Bacteroidales bacterium]
MASNYDRSGDSVGVNDVSRISAGSSIKGEITSPNDIRIDGNFEGKIISQAKVVVGEKAVIKGDIVCSSCDFWGKIDGNFFVKDTLCLKDTCVVTGDLHIRRLQVDLDATFNGNCKMIGESEFTQLTTGERPAMYDIPEPAEEEDETFKVGNASPSPFSMPSGIEIPEA